MQLKKKLLIVIGIMVLLGIGGKMYIDHQKVKVQKAEEEKVEAERLSVVALKETFVDIKSVVFKKSGYNKMTGSYNMIVEMTNIDQESVEFDYLFRTNTPEKISGWRIVDKDGVQKKGKTKTDVQVTYSNDEQELI